MHIIWIEARGANNPDYVDYKSHIYGAMWLLISSFPNVASVWIMWIHYYSNCSDIQSTMWILFGSHAKYGFKLVDVADYIRNHNNPHSIHNMASALI